MKMRRCEYHYVEVSCAFESFSSFWFASDQCIQGNPEAYKAGDPQQLLGAGIAMMKVLLQCWLHVSMGYAGWPKIELTLLQSVVQGTQAASLPSDGHAAILLQD
eukprot:1159399-Pelagomonas_calceolata.AAC.4